MDHAYEDRSQKMLHEDHAPEDDSQTKCRTFSLFVPGDLDLWPSHSNSGEIFVQCM